MKTFLTPQLLGFLIERGFTHCLAKTRVNSASNSCEIILTPLKAKPDPESYLPDYDTCYIITREPVQMAAGMDHTEIYICLEVRIKNYDL